ncbi:MAG: hypothetical protein CMH64_03605 [Nanoarchaeota archaeon]|nr:hypothetical protein [Nanoarchaeota archaeon]|tara:strand:- start:265 stop:1110 length:846 start_codon:yes stop_codon:yes gene_type:complete
MSKSASKKTSKDFSSLSRDISNLRSELNKINVEKEKWFKRKEDLKGEVLKLINEVKKLRDKKEIATKEIKKLKQERDRNNKEVKENISKIKKLDSPKDNVDNKFVKSQIEKLETSIETEALSLTKEKQIMKQINKLKKEYKVVKNNSDSSSKVSVDIKRYKTKAEIFHKKIQEIAKKSQNDYKKLTELSKKIKEINTEQEDAFANFLKFKNEFVKKGSLLESKLKSAGEARRKLDRVQKDRSKKKKLREDKFIQNKVKKVEEKLKEGKKLTKEDIMVFQKE